MSQTYQGGPILTGRQVRLNPHPIRVAEKHGGGIPQVTLQRDQQNQITEIHIRCSCGELIVLDCDYDQATAG